MRRTASLLFTTALALGAVAATSDDSAETTDTETTEVDTDHPCYDDATGELSYPEQEVWFHEGDSSIGNTAETPHPWDTTAPDASVRDGAGAGQLSLTAAQAETRPTATVFEGPFSGCIDTMVFDLYSFDPTNRTSIGNATGGNPGALSPHVLSLRVSVDGIEVLNLTTAEAATEHTNEGFGPNLNRFAIDISDSLEQIADIGSIGLELPGEHTVTVEVAPWYLNTGAAAIYVWDTTEVPSGITFNGEITEEYAALN